jgi:aconitate decarboxylase
VFVTSDELAEDHGSFVAIKSANGNKIEDHIEHAISSYEKPLTVEFLETKFMEQVEKRIKEERVEKAYEPFLNVTNVTDVVEFARSYKA